VKQRTVQPTVDFLSSPQRPNLRFKLAPEIPASAGEEAANYEKQRQGSRWEKETTEERSPSGRQPEEVRRPRASAFSSANQRPPTTNIKKRRQKRFLSPKSSDLHPPEITFTR
jgi:hypothetical protein